MTVFAGTRFIEDAAEPRFHIGRIEGAPMAGVVTVRYGRVSALHPMGHAGLDIAPHEVGAREPVTAPADGEVADVFALPLRGNQWDAFKSVFGNAVILRHADCYSLYAHLAEPPVVVEGQHVQAGTLLGFTGATGFTDGGVHLHWAVARLDNRYFNWPRERGPVGILIDPLDLIARPEAAAPGVDLARAVQHLERARNAHTAAGKEIEAALAALKGA